MGWVGSVKQCKAKIYTSEQEESRELKEIRGGRLCCVMF